MKQPKEVPNNQKTNIEQQEKEQIVNLQQSNPFKLQIKEMSNQFRMSFGNDAKQQSKKSSQNLEESNPFKVQIKKMSNQFRTSFSNNDMKQQNKKSSENLEQSNPFKMQIKQIANPFKMGFGSGNNKKEELFFGRDDSQKPQKFFENIDSKKDSIQQQLLTVPKLNKGQSKLQSSHSEQNIKKYKDTLRLFYNSRYYERIKNFEQSYRKYKRENSNNSQTISTQLRKPDICFKANRLPFGRENKMKTSSYKKLQQNYLISLKQNQQLRIYQLKHPNLKSLKPILIPIGESQIGSSVEYDQTFGRIFYFSNANQQIVVIGAKSKQVICRVKIKHHRINPLLYINKYKTNLYLLIVGGYKPFMDSIVEGSKYIQIFSIDKWEISLKQVVLRLGIGRISPIIFQCDHENQPCVYIIGGYSNATLTHRKKLNFNIDQDINFSTNQTGVRIDSSYIEDCFLGDQQSNSLLSNNINVRFDNPLQLFGGCVLFRKLPKIEKLELFLPKKREIYTIKTLKNDVHIIQSDIVMNMSLNPNEDGALNKSIGYHRDQLNNYQLFRIDDSGNLNLLKVYFYEKKNKASLDSIQCTLM